MKSKAILIAGIVDDIRRLFQVLSEQSRKVEHETGLTGPQFWVIKLLETSSPMKAADLARRMYLHPATMVGILDRLEAKELILRTRSRNDRRVIHIELTDQGREVVKNAPEVVQSLLVKGLETHTVPELTRITAELVEIIKILGAHEVPPKPILASESGMPGRRKKKLNEAGLLLQKI